MSDPAQALHWGPDGLLPVVTQDARTGEVLMLAYCDATALGRTLETGLAHYHSRSRNQIWKKGERSGNVQRVLEIRTDCDRDAILYRVTPEGPACHEGYRSCFFSRIEKGAWHTVESRIFEPDQVYGTESGNPPPPA